MHLFWLKRSQLRELIENFPIDERKIRRIQLTILGGFLVSPIGMNLFSIVYTGLTLAQVRTDILDREILNPTLRVMFIKTKLNSSAPLGVTLEVHERIIAFFVILLSRFNVVFASVSIWITFLGGLTIHEINSKLIHGLSRGEGNILRLPIMRDTLPKVQNLIKPLVTSMSVACYANLTSEICMIGEYETIDWWLHLAGVVTVIGALLPSASATAKGRKLVKAILLQDSKLLTVNLESVSNNDKVMISKIQHWPAQVTSLVSLSETSANGIFGPISYGSLGFALWTVVQFAIIMIQFFELEKGEGDLGLTT